VLMEPKTALGKKYKKLFQMNDIPYAKTRNERVDDVVIDEESGGKILRGDGALENYLAHMRSKEQQLSY
nr:hypothetical protein [Tanacetum cinerariifolium]